MDRRIKTGFISAAAWGGAFHATTTGQLRWPQDTFWLPRAAAGGDGSNRGGGGATVAWSLVLGEED